MSSTHAGGVISSAGGRQRIRFIDLARGLALLFMVSVHVLEEMTSPAVQGSWFGRVVEFLGGPPAAPVFMFLMGVAFLMSRRNDIRSSVVRGLKLLALGYLLNLLRGTVPALLGLQLGTFDMSEIEPWTPSVLFWTVDILQFAGLALMILPFVLRYVKRPLHWLALALVVGIVSPYLWGRVPDVPVLEQLLDLLWGDGVAVAFPVFPWLFYPLCGMAFGHWLLRAGERQGVPGGGPQPVRSLTPTTLIGIACLAAGSLIILTDYQAQMGDYYRVGPGVLIWIAGFILAWLHLCRLVVDRVAAFPPLRVLYFWSAGVTAFYFIQWIVIGWLTWFGPWITSGWWALLTMAMVLLLTDFLTRCWARRRVLYAL